MWDLVPKVLNVVYVVVYRFNRRYQVPHEVFAVTFDDSVYLHGVKETYEAPEISFASIEILFYAIIISTMRSYSS